MIYHLSLSPNAEADLLESALWYESRQIGLGQKFTEKLESYFSRIQNNPLHFPLKKGNLREAYIQKFPYVIIFELIENELWSSLFSTLIKIHSENLNYKIHQ